MLNFSRWSDYPETAKDYLRAQICKQVSDGDMPPAMYLLLHRDARVSAAGLNALKAWSVSRPAVESAPKP